VATAGGIKCIRTRLFHFRTERARADAPTTGVYVISAWNVRRTGGVVFVTGRGRAGFHSPDPALTRGRGGYVSVNPYPAPVRGPPALIPWTGPRLYHLFLTGTPIGYGWGGGMRGDRGRECRKRHSAPGC